LAIVTVTLNTSVDRTVEVPGFAVGEHLRGRLVGVRPAGKGVNVARCLASLGVPSTVTGFVGAAEAALFRTSLAGSLATDALVPVASATRVCTTILDPALGTDTHVREAGFHITPSDVDALRARLRELASAGTSCVFCGSLPPGITPDGFESLLAACQGAGGQVAADLSGPALAAAVAARPGLIKPNVEELAELVGSEPLGGSTPRQGDGRDATEAELAVVARGLCDRVGAVLLTRGSAGALLVTATEAWTAGVRIPRVRNTVGCGDAALAGYLAALHRGEAPEQRLVRAVACGAAKALADVAGELDPRQATSLIEQATLRRVA